MAWPAIAVSFGPIGVPTAAGEALITVVASTAARSQGRMASRRAQKASTSCAWRGANRPEAHFGVGDGRAHDAVVAQHSLLQALNDRFRLLAHDDLDVQEAYGGQ